MLPPAERPPFWQQVCRRRQVGSGRACGLGWASGRARPLPGPDGQKLARPLARLAAGPTTPPDRCAPPRAAAACRRAALSDAEAVKQHKLAALRQAAALYQQRLGLAFEHSSGGRPGDTLFLGEQQEQGVPRREGHHCVFLRNALGRRCAACGCVRAGCKGLPGMSRILAAPGSWGEWRTSWLAGAAGACPGLPRGCQPACLRGQLASSPRARPSPVDVRARAEEGEQLRVVFTHVDPRQAARKFQFAVEVREDSSYAGGRWLGGVGWRAWERGLGAGWGMGRGVVGWGEGYGGGWGRGLNGAGQAGPRTCTLVLIG